jgi:hypothetical protein
MDKSRPVRWLLATVAALALLAVIPSCAAGGQVVQVRSSAGIDAAVKAAIRKGPGTTVYFRSGSFTHERMRWPNGIHLRGDGIGKTKLNFSIEFGSRSKIGGTSPSMGLTIGSTRDESRFHLRNGAHHTRFQWVRFRSRGWVLWNICDYTSYWSDDVVRSRGNAHDIVWADCEFEYTGDPEGTTFNIWWDARRGGGNIYNLTWVRCTFGVKNSSGAFGSGQMGMLIQPSPPEHASDGPRPPTASDPGGIHSTRESFDFDQVTHGSGRAAVGGEDGYGFRIWDSRFVGPASFTSMDICDYIRAWAMVTYELTRPSLVTDAMKAAAPDRVTTKGVSLRNVWMSSELVREYGRGVTLSNVKENQGQSTYGVRPIVRTHDEELYGL